jgi:hypothetical protein
MVKFEKTTIGWDIVFNVNLTEEESSKCNMDQIKFVGDYDVIKDSNTIVFSCSFDSGELKEDETIEERLNLIKIDIENLASSCLSL